MQSFFVTLAPTKLIQYVLEVSLGRKIDGKWKLETTFQTWYKKWSETCVCTQDTSWEIISGTVSGFGYSGCILLSTRLYTHELGDQVSQHLDISIWMYPCLGYFPCADKRLSRISYLWFSLYQSPWFDPSLCLLTEVCDTFCFSITIFASIKTYCLAVHYVISIHL